MEQRQDWRPDRFDSFVGQKPILQQLRLEVASAKRAHRPLRHMLLAGPGGLGKNTLVSLLAAERGSPPPMVVMGATLTHETLSAALLGLESPGYNLRGNLMAPDVARFPLLVVDECQKVPRELLELLHPVLEPVDPEGRAIFTAKVRDPTNRWVTTPLWMVQSTFCFITNFAGEFEAQSPATLTRIPLRLTFEWYDDSEMTAVVRQHAVHLKVKITDEAAELLARRSNGMPRQAVHLLKRAIDFLTLADSDTIDRSLVNTLLDTVGIDENGLDRSMAKYLRVLGQSGSGKLGLQAIASVMGEDKLTIATSIEPVLMRRGLVVRASGGREITPAGRVLLEGSAQRPSLLRSRAV